MKLFSKTGKKLSKREENVIRTKDFFDCILPSTIRFYADS